MHHTTTTTPLHYNYSYSCATAHYIQQLWVRSPLQPLQPLQKTQLQPPFGPSMGSLCHPCVTASHLSYSVLSLKLPPPPCAALRVIYWFACLLDQSETPREIHSHKFPAPLEALAPHDFHGMSSGMPRCLRGRNFCRTLEVLSVGASADRHQSNHHFLLLLGSALGKPVTADGPGSRLFGAGGKYQSWGSGHRDSLRKYH